MAGHDGGATPTAQRGSPAAPGQSVVADYTESVVPAAARRSNFRMFLTFGFDGMGCCLFTVLFVISLGQALIGTLPAVSLLARSPRAEALLRYSRLEVPACGPAASGD